MFEYCDAPVLKDIKAETFPDGRYYVMEDGTRLPSVTTVIGAIGKADILAWRKRVGNVEANRISKQASGRGTNMHTICENYLNNNLDYRKKSMPDALEMFMSIKPLLDKHVNNIWYQECALFSKTICMAGRVDLIAEWDGKLSVIDFKTSSRIKKRDSILSYFWQETAYALMLEEMIGTKIDQIVTLMAVKDERPLVFIEKTEDHIDGLLGAIEFYNKTKKRL
jgi:genome maintenance exonuclease 1